MIFVFDLDDTVCDTDYYSEKYILGFFKENNMPYKQIAKDTRFAEAKFDWDKETALSWYLNYGDKMMSEFPCKDNAIRFINKLYDEGHTIVIATARANDWHKEPEAVTKKWLVDNNLKYHKLYIGRIDKEKICEEENADVFIDDDIKITKRVAEYFENKKKGQCYLMSTGYNKSLEIDDRVIRVKDFNDFEEKIYKNMK
jgi:uncharacterized protein YdaT